MVDISRKLLWFLAISVLSVAGIYSQEKNIRVHDPVMIQEDGTYYLFCTGWGVSMYSSSDMENWKKEEPVFEEAPEWAVDAVPGFRGHIWAPDIFYQDGTYYLYYSVSSFGKNTSCIGVATNQTLDPDSPDYQWEDQGKVIQSVPGRDLWNAIDPNIAIGEDGNPWMSFGSFWEGMKLVRLDENLIEIAQKPQEWYTIAKRRRDFTTPDREPGHAAVEAPFIFKKDAYYYLFVSFDYCCRGVHSTYKIMVGRSKSIKGPYVDRKGKKLLEGGGTLIAEGDDRWAAVGHNSAYTFNGTDYLVFHAYDLNDEGSSKLRIEEIKWDRGWPYIE